jgi:hypothetical protein
MTGLVGLNDVRAAVQAAMGTHNKTWKDSMWSDLIKDVVSFLVDEKSEDRDNVVEAAVGLIVYGATTQEKLKGVADNKEEFKRQLTADKYGVPAAICDMLFGKYVGPAEALDTGARKRSLEVAAATYDDCVRGAVWNRIGHLPAGLPAVGALFNVTPIGEAGLGKSAVEMQYCRKETVALWTFMDDVRKSHAHYGYLEGLPGTGKSTGVWQRLMSTAVRQHELVVWMHFLYKRFEVVVFHGASSHASMFLASTSRVSWSACLPAT